MSTEITKIRGVGANSATNLNEAGFTTIESVATATPESLSVVKGFSISRATRVIAAAKEIVEYTAFIEVKTEVETEVETSTDEHELNNETSTTEESTVKVEPVVAEVIVSKYAAIRSRRVYLPVAAVIVFVGIVAFYFTNPGAFDSLNTLNSTEQVAETTGSQEQQRVTTSQMPQQQQIPQHIHKQRAEAYQAESRQRFMNGQPPVEPKWVTRQRIEAEEYRIESIKRIVSGQAPVEPVWVTRQRAQAEQFRVQAEQRHIEMVKRHQAYINQRFGI